MSKDTVLLIGFDSENETDYQCVTLNLYYNETDHIIYQATDKEQVAALNEIMGEVAKEKTAMQRLEAIENSNPSEALERLEKNRNAIPYAIDYRVIKQSLIKTQKQEEDIIHYKGTINNYRRDIALLKDIKKEQEKVLNIIKNKCVDIYLLKSISTLEEYNKSIGLRGIELTQEEFDLLKRWFEQ